MGYEYLNEMPFTEADKTQLRGLGAPSPTSLRAMISASPQAFHNLLGRSKTQRLVQALEALIADDERGFARSSVGILPRTGALIDRAVPTITPPPYDIKLRDQLFEELQTLRRQQASLPSRETSEQISVLELRLNDLLAGR